MPVLLDTLISHIISDNLSVSFHAQEASNSAQESTHA